MNTVAQLKDSIAAQLTGINLDTVENVNGAIERAARTLIQKADIPEAISREQLTLYSGVYDYPISSNIFGGGFIDFRPQGDSRLVTDFAYKRPIELFDRLKGRVWNGYTLTLEWDKGTPTLRVAQNKTTPKILLDPFSDSTKWTLAGNATGLATDETVYYQRPASTRFNLSTGGSQATLTRTLTSTSDLTDYEGVGVAFLAVRLPSVSAITSIGVKIGSSASNYFNISSTTGFNGAWVVGKWLLIALDLAQATETGTVDITKVNYVQVYVNFDGTALSNVYVGSLWVSLPSPHEIIYQTSAIFMASTTLSKTITTDADSIILNDSAYTLFEIECARTIALQSGGTLASGIVQSIDKILDGDGRSLGLYAQFRADNPSEELRSTGSWYD